MSSLPVITHTQDVAWNHPHKVAIAREVVMSEDLNRIISRRTTAILVYYNDEILQRFSPEEAARQAEWLNRAVEEAARGLQGAADEEATDEPA